MSDNIYPPMDDHPLHEEEQHYVIQPLDEDGQLFTLTQTILTGPGGESKSVSRQALHVAGCNHLVGVQPGDLLGQCDLCEKWLCHLCANRVICMGCAKRICVDCLKLLDGNIPYCPGCYRKEKLKRIGLGLHRFLGREF